MKMLDSKSDSQTDYEPQVEARQQDPQQTQVKPKEIVLDDIPDDCPF